jgi:hypothetical protein
MLECDLSSSSDHLFTCGDANIIQVPFCLSMDLLPMRSSLALRTLIDYANNPATSDGFPEDYRIVNISATQLSNQEHPTR